MLGADTVDDAAAAIDIGMGMGRAGLASRRFISILGGPDDEVLD
jgi:hypothetical protein